MKRLQTRFLQPQGWAQPKGYTNGIEASGRLVFVAGQIGWDAQQRFQSKDFSGQAAQALRNTVAILAEAHAEPQHIVRMTWYILDKRVYLNSLSALGRTYREIIGLHFPAMTMVQVSALIEDEALLEIETTAVVPN